MNVLFLHSGGQWLRGSENALLAALRGLRRTAVIPLVWSSNAELLAAAQREGIETMLGSMPEIMIDGEHVRLQFFSWAATIQRLWKLIERRNIQLLYCNGGSTCQVGYYPAKLARIPLICHLHAPYNRRYVLLYRIHRASRVIFVSRAIQKSILQKQPFAGRSEVIHNGVDIHRFHPVREREHPWRERLGLPSGAVVFGQVSSLIERKGIDILLRAFAITSAQEPTARLVIVGDGPQRGEYEVLADKLGIQGRVVFTGNQIDPLPFYQHVLDVNVLASRSDAFPLSLLEASACGLPNLAASVDGIPEAVADQVTGFLFAAGDHQMLAAKMLLLLQSLPLRRALGEAGRQRAVGEFSMEHYCQSIERVIVEESTKRRIPT